jgi:aspartate kinase
VVTGFIGATEDGRTTTIGRNGSDYSAAILGAALGASAIEIWTDVDGVLSADPRVVGSAFALPHVTYEEAMELSYFGAKVLHPRAVQPARAAGASIVLKNIYDPAEAGTRIGPVTVDRTGDVKSISFVRDLSILKVFASGASSKESLLAEAATALSDAGINLYSAATSQTCIAFLADSNAVGLAKKTLGRLPGIVLDHVEVLPHASLICFVGEGLGYAHGIAARVFRAVAEERVNVQLISAGASMVAYTFTVESKDLERAVQAVHREFFGHRVRVPDHPASAS